MDRNRRRHEALRLISRGRSHRRMVASLNAILAAHKLTQAEAARLLGVNQPKVSALKGYKLEGFSVERLMHFATALEHDVVIEVQAPPPAAGRGSRGQVFVRGVVAKGAARVMVVGTA
jgi:predicted XRE-type DNA-binding protein